MFLREKFYNLHDCFIFGANLVDMKVAVSLYKFFDGTILIAHGNDSFEIL